MGRRLGRGDTTRSINLGRRLTNSRVGTTFRVIRGTGGVGTLGRGTSLGDGLGDSVGGSGVVLGGRITHFLLRLCHATSKSAARLRVTGFLIKVKGRGIFDKGDTTLGWGRREHSYRGTARGQWKEYHPARSAKMS